MIIDNLWAIFGLSSIPTIWWGINKIRAYISPDKSQFEYWDTWCAGCDKIVFSRLMEFTDSGLYRCTNCRNPQLQPQEQTLSNCVANEVNTHEAIDELFQMLVNDTNYYTGIVMNYRANGVNATDATNAAYEQRIAKMAEQRMKAKANDTQQIPSRSGHWDWTGMGKEWVDD